VGDGLLDRASQCMPKGVNNRLRCTRQHEAITRRHVNQRAWLLAAGTA
jgi:hypothetical protein